MRTHTNALRVRYIFRLAYVKNCHRPFGDASLHKEQEELTDSESTERKPETLTQALASEKKRSEEYLTRLQYMQADFENLKKRLDRQLTEGVKYGNERLIVEMLEVVDDLESAVVAGRSSKSADVIIQGVEIALKKFRKVFESEGVSPIECIGETFDPTKHDAIAKIEKDDLDECKIVEEVRKGYMMMGKVIRPSIVQISTKTSSKSKLEDSNE